MSTKLFQPGNTIGNSTRFAPGRSPNPGGKLKRVRELHQLALDESEASFRVIIAIRDNPSEETTARLAAAKLLIAYGIGEPPKVVEIESSRDGSAGLDALTVEELRALAVQSLALEAGDDDDADDEPEAAH